MKQSIRLTLAYGSPVKKRKINDHKGSLVHPPAEREGKAAWLLTGANPAG